MSATTPTPQCAGLGGQHHHTPQSNKAVSLRKLTLEKSLWKKKQDSRFGTWYMENQLTGAIRPLPTTTTATPDRHHHGDGAAAAAAAAATAADVWTAAATTDTPTKQLQRGPQLAYNHHSPVLKAAAVAADTASTTSDCESGSVAAAVAAYYDDDARHWYENWSDEHLTSYWYNPVTEESSWTAPASAVLHRMDSPSKLVARLEQPEDSPATTKATASRQDEHVAARAGATSTATTTTSASTSTGTATAATTTAINNKNRSTATAAPVAAASSESDRCFRKLRFGGLSMMGSTVPAAHEKTTTTTTTATGSLMDENYNVGGGLRQQASKGLSEVAPRSTSRRFGTAVSLNSGARVGFDRRPAAHPSKPSKLMQRGGGAGGRIAGGRGNISRFGIRVTGPGLF